MQIVLLPLTFQSSWRFSSITRIVNEENEIFEISAHFNHFSQLLKARRRELEINESLEYCLFN